MADNLKNKKDIEMFLLNRLILSTKELDKVNTKKIK